MVRGKPVSLPLYAATFIAALALILLAFALLSSPTTHAGGIIGTGGNGGSGSGDYPYSYYGHGWYVYSVGGNGPVGIGSGGGWGAIRSKCSNAGAKQVVAYIFERRSGGPGNAGIYNYHPKYDGYSAKHTGPYPWITTAGARNRFQSPQLNGKRGGYSFGNNVGWFCYNFQPPNHKPSGNIQNISCRQSDGALRVRVTFNDRDGRARAYMTYAQNSGSGNPGSWKSTVRWKNGTWWNNGRTFTVPASKVYNKSSRIVRLFVEDRLPGGGWGGYDQVDSLSSGSALPCPTPNNPPPPGGGGSPPPPPPPAPGFQCQDGGDRIEYKAIFNSSDTTFGANNYKVLNARVTLGGGASTTAYSTGQWVSFSTPSVNPYKVQSLQVAEYREYRTKVYDYKNVPDKNDVDGDGNTTELISVPVDIQGDGNYWHYEYSYRYVTVQTDQTQLCVQTQCYVSQVISPLGSGDIDSATMFTIRVSIGSSADYEPPSTNDFRLHISPDGSGTFNRTLTSPSISWSPGGYPGGGELTAEYDNVGYASPGYYQYTWDYSNSSSQKSINLSNCGTGHFQIADMPFLQVYGGDVVAGGYAQEGSTSCQIDPNAGVYGWNRNGSPDWSGAGGEIAVITMNLIQGFVSRLTTGDSNNNYSQLSFANTAYADNSGNYGGKFGAVPGNCDFVGTADKTGTDPGSVINNRINIAKNKTVTYYAKGHDVYIDKDITYTGTGNAWKKADDTPSFKLVVVGGNIYVGKNVHELDGLYVAVPNSSGNGGQIVTCSNGFSAYTPASDMFDNCRSKLTVWGAFAAKNVVFNRTYSTIGAAVSNPAYNNNQASEEFIFSPEMWIPNGSAEKSFKYDSIVSLPPVL